ncbi:MAG: hypothetical protein M1376_14375 [Planctomycetes bacterium]|nr:hypothetical protein [Planctomycetota bacterium]
MCVRRQAKRLRQVRCQILDTDAQETPDDLAVLADLLIDVLGDVGRNGEPDADIALAAEDSRIDAHGLAIEVDQRPARVARIDGGIGLDEILVGCQVDVASAQGADDAGGYSVA